MSFAQDWRETKGDHFIAYYLEDDSFAKSVADKAEEYYKRIASDLGYSRYSEFWTWEKRVKIYIYPNQKEYLAATGQPEWSQGVADYNKKAIFSFIWSKGFLESLLPHEIAHLVFRDFVGFKGEVPLWLDEGVAQWEEGIKRQQMKQSVRKMYDKDALLSLTDMMKLDIRNIRIKEGLYIRSIDTKDGDKGILFLSGDQLINTYYLESFSLVGFLIEKYGSDLFVHFCRQLRDGKSFEDALSFVYAVYINNLSQLKKQWKRYIEEVE